MRSLCPEFDVVLHCLFVSFCKSKANFRHFCGTQKAQIFVLRVKNCHEFSHSFPVGNQYAVFPPNLANMKAGNQFRFRNTIQHQNSENRNFATILNVKVIYFTTPPSSVPNTVPPRPLWFSPFVIDSHS